MIINCFIIMKKKFLEIFLVLCVLTFVAAIAYTPNISISIKPVEETELLVMSKKSEQNGRNDTYYCLLDIHHNVIVDWVKDNRGNTFSFCRGLLLIGKKRGEMELFDCRNGERKPILSKMKLDKINCRLLDIRPRYDNENLVAVIMQKKDKQGFSGKKLYMYDLKNNYLFLRKN